MAPLRFEPGQRFAGFVIDQRIGEGGMGEVYEVTHVQLRKKFALKILHRALNQDPTFAARFEREMITVSSLNHPNIVMTADGGSTDGYTWFSMTFVSGTDGQKAASAPPGGMPAARAVNIVEKVASALDYAHRRGVLHRDVKPANILLAADPDIDEEGVYLSDFGIAKVIGESTLTADGQRLLSIDFASPEQIDGTPLDPGSDIYALGATFYTLLTGRVPFPGDSWPVKVNRRFHGPVPQPSLAVPDLPPGLDAVVARALASDPAHRYASCRELAADARRALTAQSPTESPRATEPASTATQQAVTQRATRRQAAAERPSAAPTVLEPGPGDRSVARPDGPRAPHGRARRAVLIAVLVTVIAVAAGWFITSQRTSTSTSSNTPTASSSDASAATSPAVSTPPPTGETNGAPDPAATRPLSELLQPPAERRSGTVGGQPVAAAAAYAMTPKGCPTGTRQVTADLGGAYERVTANLALDDAAPAATRTNVVVAADGQELSRKILSPTEGTSWDLPVHGAGSLVITIETLGQGSCDADGYVVFVTDAVASVT